MAKAGTILFCVLMALSIALNQLGWGEGGLSETLVMLAFGLLFVFLSAQGVFGPGVALAQNAESIGTENPRLAMIACIIGFLVGGLLIGLAMLRTLHKS